MRRILILDHTAEFGGAEVALVRLLSRLDRVRFEPVVLLFAEGPLVERLQELSVKVKVLELDGEIAGTARNRLGGVLFQPRAWWRMLGHFAQVVRVVHEGRFDLVHTTSLKADLIGGLAARVAGRPLLWHLHDRIAEDYLPVKVVRVFRWLARWLPHFVVVNSEATLRTLESFPVERVMVIHPGVPEELLAQGAVEPVRGEVKVPVVGIVGRISPTKGQDIFIRAAAIVAKRFPGTRFQIIGAPLFNHESYEEEIRVLAKELRLTSLEFLGFCDDVPRRVRALAVLVHASPTPEPFGQVVVEAMALGTPVVATAAGGIPEIVVDGECGFLVPPGDVEALADRIGVLLSDPARARGMARRARERVKDRFTAERTAILMEEVYDRILGVPRGYSRIGGC